MNRFTLLSFAAVGLSLVSFIISLTSVRQAADIEREYENKLRQFEQRMEDRAAARNRDQERQDILRALAFEKITLREAVCQYLYPRGENDVDRAERDVAREMIEAATYIRRIDGATEEEVKSFRKKREAEYKATFTAAK